MRSEVLTGMQSLKLPFARTSLLALALTLSAPGCLRTTEAPPDAGTAAVLEHIGWPADSWEPADKPYRALGLFAAIRLEDDFYVGEIAAFIVGTLFDLLGVTDPADLEISTYLDDAGATAAPRLIARGGPGYDSRYDS